MDHGIVIGAFSEEQAAAISSLSPYQIRQWNREGLIHPEFVSEEDHPTPYGRLYSFRDLVSLQILDDLRNRKKISLSHLRKVADKLSHLGDEKWIATTLYVLGKRVVFENPRTKQREEIVSGQRVLNIPLRVVARNTRERIQKLNDRSEKTGQFEKHRFISGNRRVFAGTRVPVSGVIAYLQAGYSTDRILREFPDLSAQDIQAAARELENQAA